MTRKSDLINAAIRTVARSGTLGVTVAEIARDAGMSSALAHHYFGSKDQMFLSAMRDIMSRYGAAVRAELAGAATPRARVDAILRASLGPEHFDEDTVAAWLQFYVMAQVSPDAARLLSVYHRRLASNLRAALRPLVGARADALAATLGALIDGFYLRQALGHPTPDPMALIVAQLEAVLEQAGQGQAGRTGPSPVPGGSGQPG